ncbi:MAG TPA: hypothetical protein G4N92_04945 [Anaerolineae bacterium]|nr:hypothetical protein [Anaerolineae bacterium]
MNERKLIYSLQIFIGLLLLSACSSQQDVVPATHTVQPEEPDIEEPVI